MGTLLMDPENMGDPIRDDRGLMTDPHQLRVLAHALLLDMAELMAADGLFRVVKETQLQMLLPHIHALVCEDVAPGGPEDPNRQAEPFQAHLVENTDLGGNDVWSLFGKTSD